MRNILLSLNFGDVTLNDYVSIPTELEDRIKENKLEKVFSDFIREEMVNKLTQLIKENT